jgi:hypothetical protein
MEFLPANKAYQLTPSQGFRTFIKIQNKNKPCFYEPFSPVRNASDQEIKNKMVIRPFDLTIIEHNEALGIETEVSYFTLANEPFAALVREVSIKNTSKRPLELEFLDGASVIVPYGVNNFFLKEMSRTIEAWMMAEYAAKDIAVYKLTTDPRDTAQVSLIKGAHFYRGFQDRGEGIPIMPIVDPLLIFGPMSDFSYPLNFLKSKSFSVPSGQAAKNKTPCAFSLIKAKLKSGASKKFCSLVGHVFDINDIKKYKIDSIGGDFVAKKKIQNRELIEGIMDRVFTSSGLKAFDLYARQTYLDNVLRGGLPCSFSLDGHKKSIYVFSRKHGDLERDYNKFLISATYFSEGEGNYRDVNQNRRCDIFFNTLLCEKNIADFMNLIQLDGYNPLIFKGERFVVPEDAFEQSALARCFHEKDSKKMAHILSKPFALGEVLHYIEENKVYLSCALDDFVRQILLAARPMDISVFGEGYWSDHWAYNTDLLENFYALFPDRMKWLLFEKNDFTYYDTHIFVKPRSARYCVQHGEVRQCHSLGIDEEKNAVIHKRHEEKNRVRIGHGEGEVLKTTLLDKFLCLIVNKMATLDPYGVGIEMEADKPNWYDALNGLPGLLGSSISETFELKRLIEFLKKIFSELNIPAEEGVLVVNELHEFFSGMLSLLTDGGMGCFDFWDKSNALKEAYRLKVSRGTADKPSKKISVCEFFRFSDAAIRKLNSGIENGYDPKSGYYYTYFTHQMSKHDSLVDDSGKHVVVAKEFRQQRLPLFLEGFMHALRTEHAKAAKIFEVVRKSPLFDPKLKMYRVNASLEKESFEIGRAKAFTPGWLENESIWLHMEYKYLLEVLKNKLYDEFYEDFFNVLVPFQKPQVYGRSILENSSFIVSSAHPDASLHGAGFVARLSGSTAELTHMWLLMNMGQAPFFLDGSGHLALRFRPALSSRLFSRRPGGEGSYADIDGVRHSVRFEVNTYTFLFLGKTLVTYINPKRKDTFGRDGVRVVRIALFNENKLLIETEKGVIDAPYAEQVRQGKVDRIYVWLEK